MDPGFVIGALAMVAIGLFFMVRTIVFLREAVSTEGRIIALNGSSGSKGTTYYPEVEYIRPDGQPQRFKEGGSSNRPGEVGEMVPVKFDPERPERARIDKPFRLWGLPVFFFFLAALFLIVPARLG
jgi:hypothetical protein